MPVERLSVLIGGELMRLGSYNNAKFSLGKEMIQVAFRCRWAGEGWMVMGGVWLLMADESGKIAIRTWLSQRRFHHPLLTVISASLNGQEGPQSKPFPVFNRSNRMVEAVKHLLFGCRAGSEKLAFTLLRHLPHRRSPSTTSPHDGALGDNLSAQQKLKVNSKPH